MGREMSGCAVSAPGFSVPNNGKEVGVKKAATGEGLQKHTIAPNTPVRPCVAFLIPTYKTPTMCAELLYAAHTSHLYNGCAFVLLTDRSDPSFPAYKACAEGFRDKGLDVGYIIGDGVPYAGMINRVAHIIDTDCVCVLTNKHLPVPKVGLMADKIRSWLSGSMETMRVGMFSSSTCFPVVTQKMIERLGYVYHPLCRGREEAEVWLVTVAANLGVISEIPDCMVKEAKIDGTELLGYTDKQTGEWTMDVLRQTLEHECERLRPYLVQ